jgi:hypothetical protein
MLSGILMYSQVASWPVVHKTPIYPAGRIMAPPGLGQALRTGAMG